MSLRNYLSIVILLIFSLTAATPFAQTFKRELNVIPVSDGDGLLKNIFTGGINNFEYQFVDIDGDKDYDIIFLDSDGTYGWYENKGTESTPDFVYSLTPLSGLSLSEWFYFVDIDNDSDFDYFTANDDRISFFKNTGTVTSPAFHLALDTVYSNEGSPIFSEFGSNPVFADIDNDGDYDFFTGNSSGTVTFYENIGTPENFSLKFITNVWQDIVIIGGSNDPNRHGASSLDFADIDGDSDLDLFWGDFFSNSIYYIENFGSQSVPDMQLVSNVYPVNADSVNTSGFNMPRFTDIDSDKDLDMFVSVLFDPTVPQSIIFYENTGNAQSPDLRKVTDNFIKTLDVRANSHIAFADLDADGDNDLLLGSLNNPVGTLHYLENVGSAGNPSFQYFDSAYFNISGDLSVVPALGDIDGDNDFDLFVGLFNGKIDFYRNNGTPSSPLFQFEGKLTDASGSEIDVGTSCVPFLFDVDDDSDLDLITGAFNGKFSLYENTGSRFIFEFTLDEDYFAGLDVGDNSTPYLADYDNDGAIDLFSGNREAKFFYFRNTGSNQSPQWNEITDLFIEENFGGSSAPYLIDIDNDSDTDLFLGNVKGGIYFYNNTTITNFIDDRVSELPVTFQVQAYPNPFNPNTSLIISLRKREKIIINIYNMLGEKVKSLFKGHLNSGTHSFNWNGSNDRSTILSSGSYIAVVQSGNRIKSVKLTFLK